MNSLEFVEPYTRDVSSWEIRRGVLDKEVSPDAVFRDEMAPAREWSARFGQALYDRLEGKAPIVEETMMDEYGGWINTGYKEAVRAVEASDQPEALKRKAYHEMSFHDINWRMASMWPPIEQGVWEDETHRVRGITESQDLLAIAGLDFYAKRQKAASIANRHAYFDESNTAGRRSDEGVINELEASIVLLEFIKRHPHFTVIPGPIQFEHGHDSATNADFVVVDLTGRAVGVQVKSSVTDKQLARYDSDRIVLVDASLDMGNRLAVRTRAGHSNMRVESWPGLISLARVADMKLHGPESTALRERREVKFLGQQRPRTHSAPMVTVKGYSQQRLTSFKMQASHLIGNIRPRLHEAAEIVGARIMERL